jgi:2-dehydro-3-deoxygluconokinase
MLEHVVVCSCVQRLAISQKLERIGGMPGPFDFLTIGETMIRLAPPNFERFSQATSFDFQVGGAESNIAIGLARLGFHTAWLSRLPKNPLGDRVLTDIAKHGVDVSGVWQTPNDRIGTYFIEMASAPRPNRVIYDRAGSAASKMSFADLDLDVIKAARWVHLTGITPALSESCRAMIEATIALAKQNGSMLSFDVNYRALLWSPEQAARTLTPLLKQCDMLFCAYRDAINLFDVDVTEPFAAARQLIDRFGARTLVLTLGEDGALALQRDANGVLQEMHQPQSFKVGQIVDRIGAGDAFDAGFMAAQQWGRTLQESLIYGNALSALKITIMGDPSLISRDELEALVAGGRSATLR